jgi:methyltransferase
MILARPNLFRLPLPPLHGHLFPLGPLGAELFAPVIPDPAIVLPGALLLGAVAVLRLAELGLSRRWLSRARRNGRAEVIPEATYAFMVAVHAAWLGGCLAELMAGARPPAPGLLLPLGAAWLGALALRMWVHTSLGRLWNVRLVRREAQAVVTRGPYRYVRHPNYLAVIVELAVVPLMVGAHWTALLASLLNALVLWRRIRAEEAYLFAVPAYRSAFAQKKRLIPGVF